MPLQSDATIAQIISVLQTYQGLNQKADLASVIGSPSTPEDPIATLVQAVQTNKNTMASRLTSAGITAAGTEALAALAGKIPNVAARRYAVLSNITAKSSMIDFQQPDGTTLNFPYISNTISPPLTFMPTKCFVKPVTNNVYGVIIDLSGLGKTADGSSYVCAAGGSMLSGSNITLNESLITVPAMQTSSAYNITLIE